MKKIKWIAMGLLLMAASCTSSSKITTFWTADKTVPLNYKKILVLGINRDSDRTIQMNMEIHLVGDLQELGYHAISSLQEYGPRAFDKMDEADAILKLKNSGVDAVITIVLLDKERERKYIPGNMNYSPYSYYYNHLWGYTAALYHRIYEPGYYVAKTKYFLESNFYDMSTQKLVYAVQTQSFDPSIIESMGHQNGQIIIKDIVKNNVLRKGGDTATKGILINNTRVVQHVK